MASIGGVDLGTVNSEQHNKSSGLFNQPLPFSDSDESINMDLLGTSRTISIEGTFTGTVSQLRTAITNIEALQNGQQGGLTFVSSWRTDNKTCLIQEFSSTKEPSDENRVRYSLTLLEGDAL